MSFKNCTLYSQYVASSVSVVPLFLYVSYFKVYFFLFWKWSLNSFQRNHKYFII